MIQKPRGRVHRACAGLVDIPAIIALYRAGRYKLDELISGPYPLERINEAIATSASGEALRNVIVFK